MPRISDQDSPPITTTGCSPLSIDAALGVMYSDAIPTATAYPHRSLKTDNTDHLLRHRLLQDIARTVISSPYILSLYRYSQHFALPACGITALNQRGIPSTAEDRYQMPIIREFVGTPSTMVPEAGLEPARFCNQRILSPQRLPIPPFGRRPQLPLSPSPCTEYYAHLPLSFLGGQLSCPPNRLADAQLSPAIGPC